MIELHYNSEKNYYYGGLNFSQMIQQKNVEIGNLFYLSENGFYIDWSMSDFGFGQFSIGYHQEENVWYIDNESMGIQTCSIIVDTLEKAIHHSQNEKLIQQLNIFLEKMNAPSLQIGLKNIWNQAKLD
jgi:hypothetical protein